jgi:hypothetical protein
MNDEESTKSEAGNPKKIVDSQQQQEAAVNQQSVLANASADKTETTMETHAHHLHKAPGKKIWHYLFEFLMLFLAVFCGFLAENLREHQVEKDRAKQYIFSFYEDLKNDTGRMNVLIQYDEEKIAALKTMYSCYDTVAKNLKATACMGILTKFSRSNRGFVLTDRTLRQLANAGGFRLLDKEDADTITAYENMYNGYLDFQTTVFQTAQDNVRNTLNQLADFRTIAPHQLPTTGLDGDTTSSNLSGPLLFTDDRVLLNKWFNELSVYLRTINGQRNIIARLKSKAAGVAQYYKEKYHYE